MRHTSGLTYGVFGDSAVKTLYREAKLLEGDPDNALFAEQRPDPVQAGPAE